MLGSKEVADTQLVIASLWLTAQSTQHKYEHQYKDGVGSAKPWL